MQYWSTITQRDSRTLRFAQTQRSVCHYTRLYLNLSEAWLDWLIWPLSQNFEDVEDWNEYKVLHEKLEENQKLPTSPYAEKANLKKTSAIPEPSLATPYKTQKYQIQEREREREREPPKNHDEYQLADALRNAGKEAAKASLKSAQQSVVQKDSTSPPPWSLSMAPLARKASTMQQDEKG